MRLVNLAALALATFGLSSPAVAQRSVSLSLGDRGVSISARHGSFGLHLGRTYSRRSNGYVTRRAPSCPPQRVWIRGYWKTVDEKVWVAGSKEKVWREPVYETRHDSCGRAYRVLVRPGFWEWVQTPGCWVTRPQRVWVAGHWSYRN